MCIMVRPSSGNGFEVSCAACRVVVYPECHIIRRHTFTRLPDGRIRWFSHDFNTVVHLCGEDTTAVADATAMILVD